MDNDEVYIKGFGEKYKISKNGYVKSCARKEEIILVPSISRRGYERVTLYSTENGKKEYPIHRLVALHFCEGYRSDLQVNHINEIKTDNRACNLEWVTGLQNARHGTGNMRRGLTNKISQLNRKGID